MSRILKHRSLSGPTAGLQLQMGNYATVQLAKNKCSAAGGKNIYGYAAAPF